jgi:hypothetical protein
MSQNHVVSLTAKDVKDTSLLLKRVCFLRFGILEC